MTTFFLSTDRNPLRTQLGCIAASFLCGSSALFAQSATAQQVEAPQAKPSTQMQLQVLTNRIAALEQKLAAFDQRLTIDEASSTNTPQTASPVTEMDAPNTPQTPAPSEKSTEKRLEKVEQELNQVKDSQKDETNVVHHPNRVTAPFQVVDASGVVIMEVVGGTGKDADRGVKVSAMNGGYAFIGSSDPAHYANFSVHKPGKAVPRVVMGLHPDGKAGIAILGDGTGSATSELTENGGGGELQLFNPSGQMVSLIGSNPTNSEGHAKFMDAGGTPLVSLGAAGAHGDVLLFGEGKGVPVWEFMLTGFH